MMRRSIELLCACAAMALAVLPMQLAAQPSPERLALLARGINLNAWFTSGASPTAYAAGFRPEEAAFLKRAGFTFCRLPLAPDLLFDPANPGQPRPVIRFVDHAVRLLLDAGLAVVFDPVHGPSSSDAWESGLYHDPGFLAAAETYWESLARHFSAISGDRIFFEIMNEPHLAAREKVDSSWWQPVQASLAAAIRRGAPANTIVATGERWGGIDGLAELKPLPDPNVVYSFHFYDPFTFTHQGATWTAPVQAELSGLPYPSSPDAVQALAASLPDPKARSLVLAYGKQAWDAARVEAGIERAAAWAAANHAAVFCGEFGTYRKVAPAADRLRWIRDVRTILEALGIGWSMWDYENDFGLVAFSEPSWRRGPQLDSGCLAALGLDAGQSLPAEEGGPTLAAFASGAVQSLDIPIYAYRKLWTRDAGSGTESADEAADGSPTRLRLALGGSRDWTLATGLCVPVRLGEKLALSSRASFAGSGSLSLEFVARSASGMVVKWNCAAVKVASSPEAGAPEAEVSTSFVVPSGIASLEPRWSGSGQGACLLEGMSLERVAAAP